MLVSPCTCFCSKFLSKNISLERLLTEFREEATEQGAGDDSSDDLGCDDELRCNDNAAGSADSPLSSSQLDEPDEIDGVKINDTLGYCQVRFTSCMQSEGAEITLMAHHIGLCFY